MIVTYPLEDAWPAIVGRITAIRNRYIDLCDWTEDEVFTACQDQKAFLFCNDEDDSFAIVKVKERQGVKILFVWIAYGENGKRDRNMSFLKEIARNAGATRIEMGSPRRGFDRMPGWRRGMTTYVAEV